MDSSFFLTIVAGAICFFMILKNFRFKQENNSSSISPSPSSLSTSLVPPSSSSHNWIHQVFPSFRGEDVRRDFLSHIQKEFQRKGIKPFIDNEIKRGESIGPELIRAIRGSKIAIILLSRNYASSKWCLDELVEIMKCREELGQTVMAIFYKVDPSDVKKLTGDFGKVFRKTCAGRTKEDIGRWKEALMKVATIAGYHSINWDNEAAMIEKIATDVSNELINSAPSSDFDSLVGMRFHIENMERFLRQDCDEVRMIGIWGPSGIGKSTIARVLFSKHSHQFQLSVFMENVKRQYPRPCYDEYSAKLQLQSEFLSQIINQKDIKLRNLDGVQHILKENKVFVVLDDVDQLAQLEALAKELWWFGPRSRIIITTQDIKLLNAHGINHIYEVGFPRDDEAFQIFCMYAFPKKSPPNDGFKTLVWEVMKIVGTLPLGLRVMGSYFKGMSKNEWEKELPRLRISTDGEIESILKFSYNALSDEEKDLFLYIACFFNGEDIEKVKAHLADNFSNVGGSLRILLEKSLIYTSLGYIGMHNLLASLGREIVRKESTNDPGKRRFLVDARETCQALSNAITDNRSVIGIDIECIEIKDKLNISDEAFERMTSLQFLRILSGWHLPPSLNPPRKVRLLHWEYFAMTSFPSSFNPEFLVELNMPDSNLEKLWEGNQTIRNLKWMDLSGSRNLKDLPDLSTATNLQELDLSGCSSLRELPSSIGNAVNLEKLDLMGCSNLLKLPSSIENAINLLRLNLGGCSSLVELSSSIGNAINLKVLDLSDCSSLKELPSCIGNAINLEQLQLTGCSSLVELPSSIGNAINLWTLDLTGCSSLVELPSSIGNTIKIWTLDLTGCSSLVELPSSIGNAINLWTLDLTGCSSLVGLPSSIGNAINLSRLKIRNCPNLVELPSSIGNITNLENLNLYGCESIMELPASIGNITGLKILDLTRCSSIVENIGQFPHAFGHITELNLSETTIQEIAPWIESMPNLHQLVIKGCRNLVSLPQLPNSLSFLDAEECQSLESLDCSFDSTEFSHLNFSSCFRLNQEARDLIINTSTSMNAVLPGEEVPTYFTYRTTGSSLSMTLNGFDTHFPTPLRFKACLLLEGDVSFCSGEDIYVSYHIKDKQNGVNDTCISKGIHLQSPPSRKHLLIFEFEGTVSSNELVFEFKTPSYKEWEIGECGIHLSNT